MLAQIKIALKRFSPFRLKSEASTLPDARYSDSPQPMTVALANLLAQMQEDRPLTTENALGLAGYHQLGQAYRRAHKRCEGLQRGNFLANMHQLETGQASDPAKRRVHNQQILQSQQDRADLWAQIAPHKQAAQNFLQRHHSKP